MQEMLYESLMSSWSCSSSKGSKGSKSCIMTYFSLSFYIVESHLHLLIWFCFFEKLLLIKIADIQVLYWMNFISLRDSFFDANYSKGKGINHCGEIYREHLDQKLILSLHSFPFYETVLLFYYKKNFKINIQHTQ